MPTFQGIDNVGYTTFEGQTKGSVHSGFSNRTTRLQVRRVNEREQVQIEITIHEVKGERLFTHHGELVLTLEDAEHLAKAVNASGI